MAAEYTARVGRRIAERRKELHLTQRALADLLPGNTDSNQVSKWERGQHQPSPDTLEHIAKALDVDLSYFLIPAPTTNGSADVLGALNPSKSGDVMAVALLHLATGLAADARTPAAKAAFSRAAEVLSQTVGGSRQAS